MLFSSGSEICLRVMKVCSPSVLLLCLLCLSTSLSLLGTHVNTNQHGTHPVNWLTCSKALKRLLLLHCGSLPLGGSGHMIDVESPSKIVLSLLPAWWQSRQLMVLSGPGHVLVQKHPIRLQNRKTARDLINGAKEGKRKPAFLQLLQLHLIFIIQINKMRPKAFYSNLHSPCDQQFPPPNLGFLGGNSF